MWNKWITTEMNILFNYDDDEEDDINNDIIIN